MTASLAITVCNVLLPLMLLLGVPSVSPRSNGGFPDEKSVPDTAMLTSLLYPELGEPEQDVKCSVFLEKHGRKRAQQGMAISGRYIFSLEDGGGVNVYDFRKREPEPVGRFNLASSSKDNHCNNAEFGVEKKKGAAFPLLYVSVGKPGAAIDWMCFVESVSLSEGTFSSTLEQTIRLDCSDWDDFGLKPIFGAPSFLVDRQREVLWVFSARKRTVAKVTTDPAENEYIATAFRIPRLSEGREVVLTGKDVIRQVTFPFEVWFTQAGCVSDGKIFYGFGIGTDPLRPSRIRVYDTDTGRIRARYELQGIIPWEIEDIVVRGRWMYVNTNTPSKSGVIPLIYRVSLPKTGD